MSLLYIIKFRGIAGYFCDRREMYKMGNSGTDCELRRFIHHFLQKRRGFGFGIMPYAYDARGNMTSTTNEDNLGTDHEISRNDGQFLDK